MPEGHTVHRTARRFASDFGNQELEISSPQGRFSESGLISGQALLSAEAIGKQMFLHFQPGVIRIHLGIYGKWRFREFAANPPEPIGQVRARFLGRATVADLVGPTVCELITLEAVEAFRLKLGPDPLKEDPTGTDLARFLERAAKTRVPIGQLLMDQSAIAGIGNVYRAELLFRQNQNPHTPSSSVPADVLKNIWDDAKNLMKIGVEKGIMLTREGFLEGFPKPADRYYVYKREGQKCRICGGKISLELMNTRKLYWCASCQK